MLVDLLLERCSAEVTKVRREISGAGPPAWVGAGYFSTDPTAADQQISALVDLLREGFRRLGVLDDESA